MSHLCHYRIAGVVESYWDVCGVVTNPKNLSKPTSSVTYPVKAVAASVGKQESTFYGFEFSLIFSASGTVFTAIDVATGQEVSDGASQGGSKVGKVEQNTESLRSLFRWPLNRSTFRSSPRRS